MTAWGNAVYLYYPYPLTCWINTWFTFNTIHLLEGYFLMLKNQSDYLFSITNLKQNSTFGVPVSIEELTKIIKDFPILDNREGSFYTGNSGVVEAYFETTSNDV